MQTTFIDQKFAMQPAKSNPTHRESLSPRRLEQDSTSHHQLGMNSKEGGSTFNGRSRALWILLVLSVLSPTFLFALDNTVVADVQPNIIDTFGGISRLPWISVAFAMGAISFNLVWGKLYGNFDNKPIYMGAILIFEIGSAVCGAAPSLDALIVGRAIAGLGGGGIYIGTVNILTALTEISKRPLYMSMIGATWSAGTVLGPVIGGAFAQSSGTWRWAFYINLCVAALCAPVYIFVLPSERKTSKTPVLQRVTSLDVTGIILFIGASTSLVMGIAFGGAVYAWNSGQIIALFCTTGVLWIAFCGQQRFCIGTTHEHRLFPAQFLKSYEMCILFAQVAACISCIFIPVYFIPLYFQFVHGDSALEAGVRLLPFICLAVFGAMANGAVMERYGLYMPWFLVGGILITIGGSLLHTIHLDTSIATVYGYSAITAVGCGFFVQAPFSVAQARVAEDQVPQATAFISCGQISGIVLSLAIATSVFVNQAADKIAAILPDEPLSAIQATVAGAHAGAIAKYDVDDRHRILEVLVTTIDNVYIMIITGGTLAIVLSLFLKRERLFMQGTALGG